MEKEHLIVCKKKGMDMQELARSAIGVVLEDVMREELDSLIGVGWGERSPKRKGYRNGFYHLNLATNALESLWSLVRQRTDQIDVFTTQTSCLTIVWATIQDTRLYTISV